MELADLARAFPQTTIILNHVGGPLGIGPYADKKEETFAAWKAGVAELGKCQNVVVKLGGLGMLFGMFDFHTRETPPSSEELARAYKPYIETCIAAFGPDRGMFESNFPPDGVSSSYAVARRQSEAVQRHRKARLPSRLDRGRGCRSLLDAMTRDESGLPVRREMPGRRRARPPNLGNCRLAPG
jgi:predicted TIM-barrel fold metal-dependent hydrolase